MTATPDHPPTLNPTTQQKETLMPATTKTLTATLTAALLFAACGTDNQPDVVQDAAEECGVDYADGIVFDTQGTDDADGDSIDDIVCVLVAMDAPSTLAAKIDRTRALDGTQSDSDEHAVYTWGFHPDTGLSLIIEPVWL